MTRLLAIDPGSTESGWVIIDTVTRRPLARGKTSNDVLLDVIAVRLDLTLFGGHDPDEMVIEMIASYGMAVGAEVFQTCVWIGRFLEAARLHDFRRPVADLVVRRAIKLHHCHSAKAKDANIAQALVDRFAPGQPNRGKGTKNQPGWFHGFAADIWQAYALAVYAADLIDQENAPA